MRKSIPPIFALLLLSAVALAQHPVQPRLRVFIDCSNTWCDMQHIRSEINLVDFMLDNSSADVHALITSYTTGSGGNEFHLIFFGKHRYKNLTDTLRFTTSANATEFEERNMLLQYIKAGLVPFIAKTGAAKDIRVVLKSTDPKTYREDDTDDPWNSWVMRVGAGGNFSADANYKNNNYYGNLTANKITLEKKAGIGAFWSGNKSIFKFDDEDETDTFIVKNHSWSLNQYLVESISSHWSWSYELKYSQNTFSNNKGRAFAMAAVEYNIFPYEDVNHQLLTFSYGLTARMNRYYETTIYNKKNESLYGHRATAYLTLNQQWGNSYVGVSYHNYFHNWKLFNLGMDFYTSVRVAGGLSFYIQAFGALTRDQVSLVKGDASPEEVLARRRQLASGYNYYTSVGINYRFGSNTNNVVNPRFDRSYNEE